MRGAESDVTPEWVDELESGPIISTGGTFELLRPVSLREPKLESVLRKV